LLVQRHGWYAKGLEPDGKAWNASAFWQPLQQLGLPLKLTTAVDERLLDTGSGGGGLSLSETAAVAAVLEDLARKEAAERVQWIFRLHGVDKARALSNSEFLDMVDTYVITYLSSETFKPKDSQDAMAMLELFRQTWKGWPPLREWLRELQNTVVQKSSVSGSSSEQLDFQQVVRVAQEIGAKYAFFDEQECRSLKQTLMAIEGKKPGRVLLSAFYGAGMTEDTLFKFNEKVEYLRDLGVLDESDPSAPSVIIPNYVVSQPQCLEASQFYSTCCRNECEDILGHVEKKFATSSALLPATVAEAVSELSSSTVNAPRHLSSSLLEKLNQVAAINDGSVPLHGRLFGQWMHHAFPRECPFPHETGTISPRAPEVWKQETGQISTQASEEEMVCHVSGPCAGGGAGNDYGAGPQSSDLPWTDTEELLAKHKPISTGRFVLRTLSQTGMFVGILMAAFRACTSAVKALRRDDVDLGKRPAWAI